MPDKKLLKTLDEFLKDLPPKNVLIPKRQIDFIIFTGGVISGLGKGVSSASVGSLLSEQYKILPIKCDGYLNVDPGTMNPVEHGEVFVLEDGTEVDMDFGHYERFMGVSGKGLWNLTMGKVNHGIQLKERRGDYLGKTVQNSPHKISLIHNWWVKLAEQEQADVVLVEIGGTVGDTEIEEYIAAAKQLSRTVGKEHVLYTHLTYVLEPKGVKEQKTKPTQQSIQFLRQRGIEPDIIVARSENPLSKQVKEKISLFCDVPPDAIISAVHVDNIYEIPLLFDQQGIGKVISRKTGLKMKDSIEQWSLYANRLSLLHKSHGHTKIRIGICGKYTALEDSYASICEALNHASAHLNIGVEPRFIETTDVGSMDDAVSALSEVDGVIVPGGFGDRGIEGKITAVQYCRENKIPFLGICLGLQLAVVEYARSICGLENANSTEMNPETPYPVIDILPEQKHVNGKGATMRLGAYPASLLQDSLASRLYGNVATVSERHRHRYEVNPDFHEALQKKGLVFSGMSPDRKLVEFVELPIEVHPYFIGTQAHPELKSQLLNPAPLFLGLVKACMERDQLPSTEPVPRT